MDERRRRRKEKKQRSGMRWREKTYHIHVVDERVGTSLYSENEGRRVGGEA